MKWKDRGQAAAWHLLASIAVASLAAVLVFGVWYPHPYDALAGGNDLFRLIVTVDVMMGPLLTFVVFDRAKPHRELWRDLSVIVVLQLAALGYGLYTVYQARPVYLVHEVDRFRVITAPDVDPLDLAQASENFRALPYHGVRVIGVRPSRDGVETLRALESALAGKDLAVTPQRWQELDEGNRTEIRQRAKNLDFLRSRAGASLQALERVISSSGVPPEQLIALPLVGRRDDWCVVLDRRDLRILAYLPINLF